MREGHFFGVINEGEILFAVINEGEIAFTVLNEKIYLFWCYK